MTAGADLRLLRAAVFTVVCVALSMAGHTVAAGAAVPLWTVGVACALVFAVAAPLSGRERSLRGIVALLALAQVALHVLFSGGMHGASAVASRSGTAGAGGHAGHGGGHTGGSDGGGLRELAGQLLCNDGAAAALTDAQARQVISDSGLSGTPTAYAPDLSHGANGAADVSGLTVDCLRGAVSHALHQLTPVMLLGHLLAALAVGWLLSRGETALWRLIRLSATMATTAEELVTVRELRAALSYVRALRAGLLPDPPAPRRTGPVHDETVTRPVLLHHTVSRRGPPRTTGSLALAA